MDHQNENLTVPLTLGSLSNPTRAWHNNSVSVGFSLAVGIIGPENKLKKKNQPSAIWIKEHLLDDSVIFTLLVCVRLFVCFRISQKVDVTHAFYLADNPCTFVKSQYTIYAMYKHSGMIMKPFYKQISWESSSCYLSF